MTIKRQSVLVQARRVVVKVGSALVTNDGRGLDHAALARWAEQIACLVGQGKQVVLVSSGAIAEGMQRLGWTRRPKAINELQAAAAVGQTGLVQAYESIFRSHKLHAAQVLLTHEDLADRTRYLNARTTLRTLLDLKGVPIINENDTVSTDEIRLGDNDTLAALVTNLIEADCLVILTDQQGLHTADPRRDPQAKLVEEAHAGDPELERMAGGAGSHVGTGGMLTKILAAKRAATQWRPHHHRFRPRRQSAVAAGCGRTHRHPAGGAHRADDCAQAMARRSPASARQTAARPGCGQGAAGRRQEPAAGRRA